MNPLRLLVLLVSLPLLLGSVCHAELRTWTAVNGKEVEAEFVSNEKGIVKLKLKSGKVFEVPANKLSKEDNEFISSLAKPEGVNYYDELEEREGIMYLKGSDTPYTGKYFSLYTTGQKAEEGNYKDGKLDGLLVQWYYNGQKKDESNFKDGKEEGLVLYWHENGQKKGEVTYKDGKQDGTNPISRTASRKGHGCIGMKTGRRCRKETGRTTSRMGHGCIGMKTGRRCRKETGRTARRKG